MNEIQKILIEVMKNVQKGSGEKWQGSPFDPIRSLQIDPRGRMGELFIENLINRLGFETISNDETDRTKKHWDIRDITNNIDIEVKTATEGSRSSTFQFEGFEKSRNYDAAILLSISPNDIAVTCALKHELPFNKPNNLFTKNSKKMHHREHGVQYKWTLSFKDVEDRIIVSISDFKRQYQRLIAFASIKTL